MNPLLLRGGRGRRSSNSSSSTDRIFVFSPAKVITLSIISQIILHFVVSRSSSKGSSRNYTGLLVRGMSTKATTTTGSLLSLSANSNSNSNNNNNNNNNNKIIDSHLHVWANTKEATTTYPYEKGQTPPDSLKDVACVASLLEKMKDCGVDGALIVQPINHKYAHSYVLDQAVKEYPSKFKGMMLHDPALSVEAAINKLEELTLAGFVGVRYNPYLWPMNENENNSGMNNIPMSTPHNGGAGLAVYQRCGELNMPVGVMCFKGLGLHLDDIQKLLNHSPNTIMILDHFCFTKLVTQHQKVGTTNKDDDKSNDGNVNEKVFQQLLQLGQDYPQLMVKISALFRLEDDTGYPYERVRTERFEPLLQVFGPQRLLFGTDFPFVLEQEGSYQGAVEVVSSWCRQSKLNDREDGESVRKLIMGGTAERLFGPWG
mmetsp:Transcript_26709/g.29930  ORF Transcript_26709/g.29930 Transcript_26709/m.29930 type:complete len:429 (+) Transcript_26709:130-1416(+)